MTNFESVRPPQRFVSIHSHCGFSNFDGLGYPDEHIDYVLENGMDAWALTDHGTAAGHAHAHKHYEKLKKQGVKYRQLYGIEFYFVPSLTQWNLDYEAHREAVKAAKTEKKTDEAEPDEADQGHIIEDAEDTRAVDLEKPEWKRRYHLVVLAKNQAGLNNLYRLATKSNKYGYFRYPRIDFDWLKEHGEGLIVSTACLTGDTELITDNGTETLLDVVGRVNSGAGPRVLSFDEETKRAEFKRVTWGAKTRTSAKLIKIKTADGREVRLTPDHKVLTDKGWLRADELRVNMPVKIVSLPE